ncbi:hypothetical protein CTA1_9837 [Colletotrichum tanaceti]|uniref:Uncharacterized protein n=1 Tax=Colletotrichum tanaceti TaxID=1306861 RepID=A0A4U6XG97_9PEZI|nr:hypothetical protein CTA1_9837 [Colletotrichum tanaceti]
MVFDPDEVEAVNAKAPLELVSALVPNLPPVGGSYHQHSSHAGRTCHSQRAVVIAMVSIRETR